jgi:hypothetical protein
MRVLVCGGLDYTDRAELFVELDRLHGRRLTASLPRCSERRHGEHSAVRPASFATRAFWRKADQIS